MIFSHSFLLIVTVFKTAMSRSRWVLSSQVVRSDILKSKLWTSGADRYVVVGVVLLMGGGYRRVKLKRGKQVEVASRKSY